MNGGDGGEEVAGAAAGPPPPLEWKFSQVFGERTAGEEVQEGIVTDFAVYFSGSDRLGFTRVLFDVLRIDFLYGFVDSLTVVVRLCRFRFWNR